MSRHHLIRVGLLGHVGRFTSVDAARYPRGARVVVRTRRGLEIGEVLAPPAEDLPSAVADGAILRGMTVEDHLLQARLEKNRDKAFAACTARLAALGSPSVLTDVEHLFDGQSLFFYFLGEVTPEVAALTGELAELYDAQVKFRQFAQSMTEGCGPGCGTDEAEGGGCGSCSTGCALSSHCAPKPAA